MVFNFILFISLILIPIINATEVGSFKSAVLKSIISNYDKRIRPNDGESPVDVGVTMYVLGVSSLSEVQMDFTLDFYFRQFWTDARLAFQKRPGAEIITVGSEFIRNIWVPDTFFVNEKTSYIHGDNDFLRIHHSGNVSRYMRLTLTASCPMNLAYFPMDKQLCGIEIESFSYSMKDIRYHWNEGLSSVGVSYETSLPQFKLIGHRQRKIEISLSTGNYSRLACEFQFVRSIGYYLLQTYIPSAFVVIISWVSFWLNCNATSTRVLLGVICALTITTLMLSTNATLPKISYIKQMDLYLGTCFLMVLASLFEYAMVNYLAKRMQMRKNRFLTLQKFVEKGCSEFDAEHSLYLDEDLNTCFLSSSIDKYSRIIFPIFFVCFNFMYWHVSLNKSDVIADDLIFKDE